MLPLVIPPNGSKLIDFSVSDYAVYLILILAEIDKRARLWINRPPTVNSFANNKYPMLIERPACVHINQC
jgi:hypothetical protein